MDLANSTLAGFSIKKTSRSFIQREAYFILKNLVLWARSEDYGFAEAL